jgi:hypothetical protein
MNSLKETQKARIDIWKRMPAEVKTLHANREIMQPAGRTIYAEAETRVLTELLHLFLTAIENEKLDENVAGQVLHSLLDHFGERLGGWYGLKDSASVVLNVKRATSGQKPAQFMETVKELSLYMGRLNLWIDLTIPWNDINELMRNHANEDAGFTNVNKLKKGANHG